MTKKVTATTMIVPWQRLPIRLFKLCFLMGIAVSFVFVPAGANDGNMTCGFDTISDVGGYTCLCDKEVACDGTDTSVAADGKEEADGDDGGDDLSIFLAGVFDQSAFYWGRDIMDVTIQLLNDPNNGFHNDVASEISFIEWALADSDCDTVQATQAYWELRSEREEQQKPIHGIIGSRCSGATTAVASIAGLEGVPQVSPSSTSVKISDKNAYPFVTRLVSPDDHNGQVGALVAAIRLFGWERVTVLATDTQYARDLVTSFRGLWVGKHEPNESSPTAWEGEVAYSNVISLTADGSVDDDSVRQVLQAVPTDDPTVNSRIIFLAAHDQHAFPILKVATETGFQPDTIWIGPQAWAGRFPKDGDTSWMSHMPGYLGITPFRNRNNDYDEFLTYFQNWQQIVGQEVWDDMPDYAAEYMVDSIVALSKALAQTPPHERKNGTYVSDVLRSLTFDGVSGPVSFTSTGDRRNPKFTIFNLQHSADSSFDKDGSMYEWVDVGSTGSFVGSASFGPDGIAGVCFAQAGCGLDSPPPDTYPVPKEKWPVVVFPILCVLLVALCSVAAKYSRSKKKKAVLKSNIAAMQRKMEDLKRIDDKLAEIDDEVDEAKRRKQLLILKRADLVDKPSTWSNSTRTLVEVEPHDEQYWAVADKMKLTMKDAHIAKLWRVQNKALWSYFTFHKERMAMTGVKENEKCAWHGTSSTDPSVIYGDRQDGFMMQYSRDGLWGRGIYFANNSSYSDNYAYRANHVAKAGSGNGSSSLLCADIDGTDRPTGSNDEKEMFLVKLLIGNEKLMDQCRSLTVPPTDPTTGLKHNTVTGYTGGSQVWIVYENGRAYPDYLVRYYRGRRDVTRTPYETRHEAMIDKKKLYGTTTDAGTIITDDTPSDSTAELIALPVPATSKNDDDDDEDDDNDNDDENVEQVVWEFMDDAGTWTRYSHGHNAAIERRYQAQLVDQDDCPIERIKTNFWTYEVDVNEMIQTNIDHGDHRQRQIRRVEVVTPV